MILLKLVFTKAKAAQVAKLAATKAKNTRAAME
jgi:hypothetical protein